jgi:Flp pilus assembly protein TadG
MAPNKSLTRLFRDVRGNVAPMFALACIPIIGSIGAAIDYSGANSVRSAMQSALDATALQLSQSAPSMTDKQLQQATLDSFNALFTRPGSTNIKLNASFTDGSSGSGSGSSASGGSSLTVSGSVTVPNRFLGLLGFPTITVSSASTVNWGSGRVRVALVLDNTGSMASAGKIDALKNATKGLLAQLKSVSNVPDDVYVSIIPFSKDVNVGPSNADAKWLDWTAWDAANGQSVTTCDPQGNCAPKWVPADHANWNGCVTDRGDLAAPSANNYDRTIDKPVGKPDSQFPAEQYGNCVQPMMGLSNDWSTMNNLVDKMQPAGSTNQPIGLVWGWMSLTGGGPLTVPPKAKGYSYKDVIIILSDGLNTQNRWYGNGSDVSTDVDARMYAPDGAGTCYNIKQAGITVYTVHVNTDGDPMSKLLQNCASTPDNFVMLTSANQMVSTFKDIGAKISKLRIAK